MGFFGETIRSIQYTGRIKERTVAQPDAPDNERRQTFEEHRDEASRTFSSWEETSLIVRTTSIAFLPQ